MKSSIMDKDINMNNEIQFILYQLPDDEGKVQVVIKDETIWATQKAMAQLFDIDKSGISRHISNILKEGELRAETTVAKIATVVNRGIRGEVEEQIDFYNLDMIIAVGYRERRLYLTNRYGSQPNARAHRIQMDELEKYH